MKRTIKKTLMHEVKQLLTTDSQAAANELIKESGWILVNTYSRKPCFYYVLGRITDGENARKKQ